MRRAARAQGRTSRALLLPRCEGLPQPLPSAPKAHHSPGRSGRPPAAMSAPKPPTPASMQLSPAGLAARRGFFLNMVSWSPTKALPRLPTAASWGGRVPSGQGRAGHPTGLAAPRRGAAARTQPSESVFRERRGSVRLEAAGPAGTAACFPSLRGAAFSREFLLQRTQKGLSRAKSRAGRAGTGWEAPSPRKLPGAPQPGEQSLPAQGQVSAQPEEPAPPY